MQRIVGWWLTYLLPWALLAHGTVNNGDDTPWILSLFCFAPIVVLGFVLLTRRWRALWSGRWFGLPHIGTFVLAARVLPIYWQRVTISGGHIGAVVDAEYGSMQPAPWHAFWAPVMTVLVFFAMLFNILSWIPRKKIRLNDII